MQAPINLNNNFLGLINMQSQSLVIALLAGLSQFVQGYLSSPIKAKTQIVKEVGEKPKKSLQEELSNSMQMNIKYILPIFIVFIAYKISAAVALYWFISNVFTIVQEWYIRKSLEKQAA